MEGLRTGDWIMILAYGALMLLVGVYCIRFSRQGVSYFAGGRKIPWWVSGISGWMSAFSAYVFVGLASKIYSVGIAPLFHILFSMAFAWLVGSFVWARRWRKTGIITVPEYMENRFNLMTRQVFAWVVVPFRILDDGVKCYSTALIIATVFGIPYWFSITGLSLITIIYTMIGGLWAVMITDIVQFVILVVVVFVVLPVGLDKIGWMDGITNAIPTGFYDIFHPVERFNGDFTIMFFVAMWIMTPLLYNGSFSMVQRYTTVPTPRDAKKSALLSFWLGIMFFPFLALPPMISRFMYGDALLATTTLSETSYIKLCMDLLPVGMIGMVVVAIMAATMSALAGDYNIYGAVLTNDFYNRLINRKASQKRLALVGRFNTFLVGALALVVAIMVPRFGGAFKVMMFVLGMIGAPTTLPILLGLWFRKTGPWGAITACLSGVAIGLITRLGLHWDYGWFVMSNVVVTTVVFFASGILFPAKGAVKRRVDELFDRVLSIGDDEVPEEVVRDKELEESGQGWREDKDEVEVAAKVPSPYQIVGQILLILGVLLGAIGFTAGRAGLIIDSIVSIVLIILGILLVMKGRSILKANK